MSPKPEGYAPDMFSEHARAAQLGLAARSILREAVADAKGAGFVWPWIHKAERELYNLEEVVCVPAITYIGNPHEWLSARCPHCRELVPLGQGERYGTAPLWAHKACNLRTSEVNPVSFADEMAELVKETQYARRVRLWIAWTLVALLFLALAGVGIACRSLAILHARLAHGSPSVLPAFCERCKEEPQ